MQQPLPPPSEEPEGASEPDEEAVEPSGVVTPGFVAAARITTGTHPSRYAGAMLLHAYLDRVGAETIFATMTGGPARRFDDLAVLCTAILGFAWGIDTIEASKHLRRAEAGATLGLTNVPELETLRGRLVALADGTDPLGLQRAFRRRDAGAPVLLGFDRGGAYPVTFTACRDAGADWITYRRGP